MRHKENREPGNEATQQFDRSAMSGLRLDESKVLMSDIKESNSGEETGESVGEERSALIAREERASDGEVYSYRRCLHAKSCKIGLMVSIIALVFVLAGLILILVAGLRGHLETTCNGITLDDVFNDDFKPNTYHGKWTSKGQLIHLSSSQGLRMYNPSTNHSSTIISNEELAKIAEVHGKASDFKLSPKFDSSTNREVLLISNSEQVYRHSTLADYVLYREGTVLNLTKPEGLTDKKIQFASWSPAGDHIAMVIDYDIYLVNASSPTTEPVAVTTGGTETGVYNGIPDWVYEEEVFSTDNTLWWSPDGTAILYASFNDTMVREFSFPEYGSPDNQYTEIKSIPYPKPGTTNPTVTMFIANISDPSNINTTALTSEDHYVIYAGWVEGGSYFVCWLNRDQNHSFCCTYDTGSCVRTFSESHSDGWVELTQAPIGRVDASDQTQFYTIYPVAYKDDSYPQLVRAGPSGGVVSLTGSAPYEVTSIVGVTKDYILYVSTEKGPGTRHVYSYSIPTNKTSCLTCSQEDWGILDSPNPSLPHLCDYFTVSCDDQLNHCLLSCRGPCIPFSLVGSFNTTAEQFQPIKFLERNHHVHDSVREVCLPKKESFMVPADSEGGWAINGEMLLPPQFDASKKYSVLVYVYGGPHSQTVAETCMLNSLNHLYYVTELNIILASFDGRGTGYRGQNFKFSVYRDLGNLETVDQLRGGNYMSSLPYVDGSHLAIMGSSYGGYMAGRVGSSGTGVYSTAISQAPVTDWRYYDTIYTERYMNEPEENPVGYANSSVLARAKKLDEVHFLLIHGTGDDNVHFQHTAQLVEALTQDDIQFRLQIYTDKTHSISGGNTRRHLYELISDFLREHLYD